MKRKLLILSLMIGIAIVIYPYVGQYIGNQIQKKRSEQFQQYVQQLSDEEKKRTQENIEQCVEKVTESDFDFYDPWSEETNEDIFAECVDDETFGNQGENPESTTSGISDLDSISTLESPKLDLSSPIYLRSSEASLSRGLGQGEGSPFPFGG